jgi:hypothetical protein
MLINSKVGRGTYLLDKEHFPLMPDFEGNTVVMDASHPTSVESQEKREKAKAEKASKIPDSSVANLKTKQDQLSYLLEATVRIEKGLTTLTQNQESLERIIETKFYDLDLKVTEIQTAVEQLQEEAEERRGRSTTDAYQRVPRAQRSAAVLVTDTRATTSAPATTASVAPPVATPQFLRHQLKSLQMLFSPSHLRTLELLEIVLRVPYSTMHFQAFW